MGKISNIKSDNGKIFNKKSLIDTINNHEVFKKSSTFAVPIGYDIDNKLALIDLSINNNIIIAGSSSTGKTTLILTILISLMIRNPSDNLKFHCIDTSGVEYFPILKTQYSLFGNQKSSLLNAIENIKIIINETKCRLKDTRTSPKIICVLDDFADVQTECNLSKFNVFDEFINLISLMNSVGIFVIMSTSRTTPKILTNQIKEIFTTRIAFPVLNSAESELLLNAHGAEQLSKNPLRCCLLQSKNLTTQLTCLNIDIHDI